MLPIYNILIRIYGLAIKAAALFGHEKAQKRRLGQKNLFKKLEDSFQNNTKPVVWFHCASLGEFEQGRPVMELLRKNQPDLRILLTFFSPSGYEIRKDYPGADDVFYLPADTRRNARRFVDIVKPAAVLFIKYEFWYHFLHEISQREIPAILFSAIFRENQLFFKSYGTFYRNILKFYTKIFVQDRDSLKLLRQIGIENAEEAGDTRFDRVIAVAEQRKQLPEIAAFKNKSPLMVVGSSWPADLEVLLPVIETFRSLKFIIAPHEIKESDIETLINALKRPSLRYSRLGAEHSGGTEILVIDNIGLLSSLYGYADFAYVGGAFGKGLHNILEAAVYGIPVFFGPKYDKFKEALDLTEAGGVFPVRTTEELGTKLDTLIHNHHLRETCGSINKQYIYGRRGASETVYHFLIRTLGNKIHSSDTP